MTSEDRLKQAIQKHQAGEYDLAIAGYQEILQNDSSLEAFYMLAVAHFQKGELSLARRCLNQYMKLEAEDADAWNLLGNVCQDLGDLDAATDSYMKAFQLDATKVMALNNLGTVYRQMRKYDEAIRVLKEAVRINPDYCEAINNLGNVYFDQDQLEEALFYYEKSLQMNASYQPSLLNRGLVFQRMGRLEEALKCYETLMVLHPEDKAILWVYWLSLPGNYASVAQIKKWRDRFVVGLDKIAASICESNLQELQRHYAGMGLIAPFFLGYQGHDDFELMKSFGESCVQVTKKLFPQWHQPKRHYGGRKKRIGFISGYIYKHTVAKLFFGWVKHLDKSLFDVYVYHAGDRDSEEVTLAYSQQAHVFRRLNGIAVEIAQTIFQDELDALIYLDLGMFPKLNQLASLRLANVQCVTWGHPVTSGLPTIDYFLTAESMEPEVNRYTEQCHRLPRLSISYDVTREYTNQWRREHFGLSDSDFVYLCCQFLSKHLPQFDFIYPQIALAVPRAKFVFILNGDAEVQTIFKLRLQKAFSSVGLNYQDYIVFVGYLAPPEYQDLNRISDVYLDSILWSGGNTTLEALSITDMPIVTCRGPLMRSNHTAAMLDLMGLRDHVQNDAATYVSYAIRLAQDRVFFDSVKKLIKTGKQKIFGDIAAVESLGRFLNQVTNC